MKYAHSHDQQYPHPESWLYKCLKMSKSGLRHVTNFGDPVHCGHGNPVKCCYCGKPADPFLNAVWEAGQDAA